MKHSILALSCSLLLACGASSWVMAEPTTVTTDVIERVDASQNQFVQNDRHAFFLKGDVKQYSARIYYFDYEDLDADLNVITPENLGFSIDADFNEAGFSDFIKLAFYQDGELQFAAYRTAEPYENNARKIYSLMRNAGDSHDKAEIQQTFTDQSELEEVQQSWTHQRSTTNVANGVRTIIEEFDGEHRPTLISTIQDGNTTHSHYLYLPFAELKTADFESIDADIIEIQASRADIQTFTDDDFQMLDPRVKIVVKEMLDTAGNPQIQWTYSRDSLDKEVVTYQYY